MGWVPGGELRLGGGYVSMRRRSWTRRLDFTPLVKISSIKTGTGGRHLPSHENHTYICMNQIYGIYIYIYHTRDDGSWVFRVTSTSPSVSLANIGRNNICSQEKPPKIKEIHGDWCFFGGAILGDFSTQIWSEGTGEHRGTIFVKIGSNSPCC